MALPPRRNTAAPMSEARCCDVTTIPVVDSSAAGDGEAVAGAPDSTERARRRQAEAAGFDVMSPAYQKKSLAKKEAPGSRIRARDFGRLDEAEPRPLVSVPVQAEGEELVRSVALAIAGAPV